MTEVGRDAVPGLAEHSSRPGWFLTNMVAQQAERRQLVKKHADITRMSACHQALHAALTTLQAPSVKDYIDPKLIQSIMDEMTYLDDQRESLEDFAELAKTLRRRQLKIKEQIIACAAPASVEFPDDWKQLENLSFAESADDVTSDDEE